MSQEKIETMFKQKFGRQTKSVILFLKVAYTTAILALKMVTIKGNM